jgi:hypothetical protein
MKHDVRRRNLVIYVAMNRDAVIGRKGELRLRVH